MILKTYKKGGVTLVFFIIGLLTNCRYFSKQMVDKPPILFVTILPMEPTDYRQLIIITNAMDDVGLSCELLISVDGIASRGKHFTPAPGQSLKEITHIDSLVPHILSEDKMKKVGDSLVVTVTVYDKPRRQATSVSKVIKLKKEEK